MDSLIMAHAGGKGHGRENSVEAVQKVSQFQPDIIELDIHKSKDSVLFCYHGSIPFGFLLSFFVRYLKFSTLQNWLQVDKLSTIVKAISYEPILFLDIWQNDITANDLKNITYIYPVKKIWIASRLFSQIKDIRTTRGDSFQYVLNRGIFFTPSLEILQKSGVNTIKLFWWQYHKDILQKLKENNISFGLSSFGLTQKQYIQKAKQYKSLWICYDRIPKKVSLSKSDNGD